MTTFGTAFYQSNLRLTRRKPRPPQLSTALLAFQLFYNCSNANPARLVLNVPEGIGTSQNDSRTQSAVKKCFHNFMLRIKGKIVVLGFSTVILYPCEARQKVRYRKTELKYFLNIFEDCMPVKCWDESVETDTLRMV